MDFQDKYINPFTDFGFKKLFGSEINKDLLIDFLNELLKDKEQIADLAYLKNENLGDNEEERKAVFDLYCENDKGEKFIIEIQRAKQDYFKDRSIFYSTFPIREQAEKGNWNFQLKAVYTVAILDFNFDKDKQFQHVVKLVDQNTEKVFYDKLTYVYLEIPKFSKNEQQLETHFDKWLFLLKNLHKLTDRPIALRERIFSKVFEIAEIARFTKEEMTSYQESLKSYRDYVNTLETAKAEGANTRNLEIAKALLTEGVSLDTISRSTGLSIDQINSLKSK